MPEIIHIEKNTDNRFLNLYTLNTINKYGKEGRYFVASRAKSAESLKISTKENKPDGVILYGIAGENQDKVVLIRQYRYSIDDYIYEFPAGLVEEGEDFHEAGIREMKEETGLDFHPLQVDPAYEKPFFTTVGMTDESCSMVFGTVSGEISSEGLEDSEVIEVVLADRQEAMRILREEHVAMMCAYMLMHFIHDDDPFAFLKD